MCNPGQALQDFGEAIIDLPGNIIETAREFTGGTAETIRDLGGKTVETARAITGNIAQTVENIAKNPLPMLETIALTYAGIPAPIASAVVTAANGGNTRDIVLSAATAYASSEIGKYTGDLVPSDYQTTDPQYTNQQIIKQVVTSASGSAAVAALQGKPLSQVLSAATSGAVYGYVNQELVNYGINPGDVSNKMIASSVSAATKAILDGKDWKQAVGQSVATVGIQASITSGIDYLKNISKQNETLNTQRADAVKKAQSYEGLLAGSNYRLPGIAYQYNEMIRYIQNKTAEVNEAVIDQSKYREMLLSGDYSGLTASDIKTANDWYGGNVSGLVNTYYNNARMTIIGYNQSMPDMIERFYQSKKAAYEYAIEEISNYHNYYNEAVKTANSLADQIEANNQSIVTKTQEIAKLTEDYNKSVAADVEKYLGEQAAKDVQEKINLLNEDAAKAAGFPDYATSQQYDGNFAAYNEDKAVKDGWNSFSEKQAAAQYEITSPQKYQEFIAGKTEEDKVIQLLQDKGITPSPERVAGIMKEWDFNPTTPNVGFNDALEKSDKLNISNTRADSIQEAAALAKSLGYSNFNFGGGDYKINPAVKEANPYDFFVTRDEAFKAARSDLGAGKYVDWTNPITGKIETFSTNTPAEQLVADQKRIDMMPAYGGARNTQTGKPTEAENLYIEKKTGQVVNDTRVWDALGNVVSGELSTVNPNASGSTAEKVAANINEGLGKAVQAYLDVSSGVIKGGANMLNQIGTLGGMTGLVGMDNWMTESASDINKSIDSLRSNEFKNNEKLLNDAIAKAGDAGFVSQAIEAAKQFGANPLQTAEFIAKNGVTLLVGGGAMSVARALGAGMSVAEAAAIGANAVTQGADVASEAYKDALKNGKSEQEALDAARVSWAGAALTSAVANKLIPGALSNETAVAAQGVAKNSLVNALKGEMSSELAEEVSGKVIANIASGNAWDKDLGSTAVQALIGSGAITGLVQVAQTGNLDTAVAMAKDAGVSQQQIDQIESAFKGSIGTSDYTIQQAKDQLQSVLSASNLGSDAISQVSNLLVNDSLGSLVKSSLEAAGVPETHIADIANQVTQQLMTAPDQQSAFSGVSSILQNNGLDPVTANLVTNQTLTGTNVKESVANTLAGQEYQPTQEEINALISQTAKATPEAISTTIKEYTAPRIVTFEEAKKFLVDSGYNPTDTEVNQFVGQQNNPAYQQQQQAAVGEYVAPRIVTFEEAKKFLTDANYNPTDAEVNQFVGQLNDAAYQQQQQTAAGTYAAPRTVTFEEAKKFLVDSGYNPTDAEVNQFVGQQNNAAYQQQQQTGAETYAAPRVVTFEEAKNYLTGLGYNPTDAEINQFVGQLNDAAYQQQQQTAINAYVDPRLVTEQEVRDEYAKLGLQKPTQEDVQKLVGQYAQTDLSGKATENLDTARYNSVVEQINNFTQNQVQTQAEFEKMRLAQEKAAAEQAARDKAAADAAAAQAAALQKQLDDQKAAADAAAAAQAAAAAKTQQQSLTQSALSMVGGTPASMTAGSTVQTPLQPQLLTSKETPYKFVSPLAGVLALSRGMDTGENQAPQGENKMQTPHYSYGNVSSIDEILGMPDYMSGEDEQFQEPQEQQVARGGLMMTPLMAVGGTAGTRYGRYAGGGLPGNVVHHSGKARVDFRRGDAVTGAGDGQSDDIPAMLADGEFVFPADVVAAIGNGSTKAGSDKLYDMMHGIRAHVRSAKPQDLPPEIKSPLDFLGKKRRKV